MSYMRDGDRATRGVGAIAATDRSPRRQRQRARMALATSARDRAMAAVTRGSLGAVPLLRTGAYGGAVGGNIGTSRPIVVSDAPSSHPLLIDPLPPAGIGPAPLPSSAPSPALTPATTTTGPLNTGVPMGIPASLPPIAALPPLDVTPPVPAPAAAPDNTTRNLLIASGAAVAAYFLFFRKKAP